MARSFRIAASRKIALAAAFPAPRYRIRGNMDQKLSDKVFETAPKKPNFLLILILSGVTLMVLFAAALLLLTDSGKKLLPKLHPDHEPTSFLMQPAQNHLNA